MAWAGFVQLMSSQLEGLRVSNAGGPLTFLGVGMLMLLVVCLATWIPSRRATRLVHSMLFEGLRTSSRLTGEELSLRLALAHRVSKSIRHPHVGPIECQKVG